MRCAATDGDNYTSASVRARHAFDRLKSVITCRTVRPVWHWSDTVSGRGFEVFHVIVENSDENYIYHYEQLPLSRKQVHRFLVLLGGSIERESGVAGAPRRGAEPGDNGAGER